MSLDSLYDSIVKAFPNTSKRQYATDTIKVIKMDWTPFVGMKTLFVKGLVENEGKIYDTIILFKDVNYNVEMNSKNAVPLVASDGMLYYMGKIDENKNDVLARCNCPDYQFRFAYYNQLAGSLWGVKTKKYESQGGPPANPKELPGLCKHLLKTSKALSQAKIFI